MVETNETLLTIGNEEAITLKPSNVKILSVETGEFGKEKKKGTKVTCLCKHPDASEPIHISSVKYLVKDKIETAGLWINKDSKGLIRKGSALAVFLNSVGAKTIAELKDKEVQTIQDDKGYLVFKAY